MKYYIGLDKDGQKVIKSIYKDLVRAHISVVIIEEYTQDTVKDNTNGTNTRK